jgi:chemotaxis methyl-accepting protein methylase/FixJ family two-component response regulator
MARRVCWRCARGGFVVAQDPAEAEFAGMPGAAIAAGGVDAVLPIAAIPEALLRHLREAPPVPDQQLARIVALLRARTEHDFSPYKPGTLRRRIERRIGMLGCADTAAYAARLEADPVEQGQLVKDLLIHVTGFFRDREVFEALATTAIPSLVAAHSPPRPLRVWVVACSTGEEAWSLAMLFHEAIAADGRGIRLQIFASDKDADSVAQARQGFYPASVTQDVSAERLAAFFVREEAGFRVTAELGGQVVFSVQNAITDPPFSQLDFVSCRNLLIYLRPEAQGRLIALFRFALHPGGLLLLGVAETVAESSGFEVVNEGQRLWRREGRVILLTADMSEAGEERAPWTRLRKPVGTSELVAVVRRLLDAAPEARTTRPAIEGGIHVVDDDPQCRDALRRVLEGQGQVVTEHPTAEAFLAAYRPGREGCLVLDAQLPGISGLDLLRRLRAKGDATPVIVITGSGNVEVAMAAMRAGASGFFEKPVQGVALLTCVRQAIARSRDAAALKVWREVAAARISGLTPRQREVMDRLLAGAPSKNIAADIGISQRTVEAHRAEIMRRTGTRSLPELARLVLAAAPPA